MKLSKKSGIIVGLVVLLFLIGGLIFYMQKPEKKPDELKTEEKSSLNYNARIEENSFEVYENGKWVPMTIKGVNMGMAKPGTFPGEAGITEEEYYRWFEQIGEMNANTIRVYTIHPPGFYNALKKYNEKSENPIYIFHGVWMNEEKLVESMDAFEPENLALFKQEMESIVDLIHGNKAIEPSPGHAHGVYESDVSQYIIGWIIGVEWNPEVVLSTNEKHSNDVGDYAGTFFETKDAQPFESWLAQLMDELTQYELDEYDWKRPMSFTNWVTTDILEHPADSSNAEDIVSVDPNVIYAKGEAEDTGQFASYHVYPYYPDFLNYDADYLNYEDHRGEKNNYAGYLNELKSVHRLPILVAEFGVPASRGMTHTNPFGKNQGFLSETEQGEIISSLYEDILAEDYLGGLIFSWQDEWFKRTWNTMDYDNPDRRPFWSNVQTNEQRFGLLSFDPLKIHPNGNKEEWTTEPIYEKEDGDLKALYTDHDETYLYVRLDIEAGSSEGYPIILLDTVPDQGNQTAEKLNEVQFKNGADFLIQLNGDESHILINDYYDFYTYQYGIQSDFIDPKPEKPVNNSGKFVPIHFALNKEYYLPTENRTIPFQFYETGKLKEGNGDPTSENYDSLTDYHISEDGMIELRIPWLLLQAKDPSQKEFIGDIYKDGISASKVIDEISIGALYVSENGDVIDSFPALENEKELPEMKRYTWENWELPQTKERLKTSYQIIKQLFSNYK